ncbi:unnamed protein product [Menidia menidia]|uniref:(Atlantic silverside) hypothetical protein n=1 Tax=Menidia menidia TaxID=238744 RepID=A0A8S4AAC8_9TELE|nr:unnamed protein product [Menidia menidia]
MSGKKKSCFQITSVTQAEGAAKSIPDDTESLEYPDESRTEDGPSQMFDVSRLDPAVGDRSSSEEFLNHVGDSQESQPPAGPVNGGLSVKSAPTGRVTPHGVGGNVPVPAAAQPSAPSSAVSSSGAHTAPGTSCSSRFRVIKLDHGTGEPFRRGRWTCTEFYERDSDVNRTVDSIKPTVTLDHSTDRDSGLGATSNSIVTGSAFSAQALETTTDSGYAVSAGHSAHSHPPESLQKGYGLSTQIGSGLSAFQHTGCTVTPSPTAAQAQVNVQSVSPQSFLSNSLNGAHQGAMQSPIKPPASQAQQFAYSTRPTGHSSGHPDYHQQHFGSGTQNFSIPSSSVESSASQVSPPQIPLAGSAPQGLGGETGSAPGLVQQAGHASAMVPIHPGSTQQQHVSQTQPSGGLGITIAPSATSTSHVGGQNVPATVPSTSNILPAVSSMASGKGGLVQLQGAHGGATKAHPSLFFNPTEDGWQQIDALPQHSASMVPLKDGVKPPITGDIKLANPAVNSFFGIRITMDMDEDRISMGR